MRRSSKRSKEFGFLEAHKLVRKYAPVRTLRSLLVADLGCGNGDESVFLAEHGYKVVAIDQDQGRERSDDYPGDGLARLSQYARMHELPIATHQLSLQKFLRRTTPETYDVIVALYVLHFRDSDGQTLFIKYLHKIIDSLRMNGRFICTMLKAKLDREGNPVANFLPAECDAMLRARWSEWFRTIHYDPHRWGREYKDGQLTPYRFCHWELVADRIK